jgi:hypothetical protein
MKYTEALSVLGDNSIAGSENEKRIKNKHLI